MTDNNIVNLPTPMNVLADRIRGALASVQRGHIETIEGMLELAVALKRHETVFPTIGNFPFGLPKTNWTRNSLDTTTAPH